MDFLLLNQITKKENWKNLWKMLLKRVYSNKLWKFCEKLDEHVRMCLWCIWTYMSINKYRPYINCSKSTRNNTNAYKEHKLLCVPKPQSLLWHLYCNSFRETTIMAYAMATTSLSPLSKCPNSMSDLARSTIVLQNGNTLVARLSLAISLFSISISVWCHDMIWHLVESCLVTFYISLWCMSWHPSIVL